MSSSAAKPAEARPTLRRELGIRDVTLSSLVCIAATRWIPTAAAAGPGSISLWFLAALLFAAPLAVAVTALTVKYPDAGGMYLWTRNELGDWHGFLCSWVYWMGIAIWFPGAAMFYMSMAIYTLAPGYRYLSEDRLFLVAASLAAIWIALGTNLLGLRIGKLTQNLGGAATGLLGALLCAVALLVYAKRGTATPIHIAPRLSWATLGFSATISYAMSGLEMLGPMGGEIREPGRTVPRAGWIASGLAAVFYASTTLALLVLVPSRQISELNGLAQGSETAARLLGAPWLPTMAGLLIWQAAWDKSAD
jgi:amino acid transporter